MKYKELIVNIVVLVIGAALGYVYAVKAGPARIGSTPTLRQAQDTAVEQVELKVGDVAPDFTLPSTDGSPYTLSDYRGQKNVVLAFYPLAFTPVWSQQLPSYEADLAEFERYNTQVLGISVDSPPCNNAFAESLGIENVPLLSDFWPHGEVAKRYGVLRKEGYCERALFIVDKEGIIRYIDIHNIDEQPDNQELFDVLEELEK